jgi:hypothetical protein
LPLSGARVALAALRRGTLGMWMVVLAFASYLSFMLLRMYQPDLIREAAASMLEWFR